MQALLGVVEGAGPAMDFGIEVANQSCVRAGAWANRGLAENFTRLRMGARGRSYECWPTWMRRRDGLGGQLVRRADPRPAREEDRHRASAEGDDSFVPLVREARRWSDRTKIVETPVFSCYVFVRMEARLFHLEVLKTAGVFRFVTVNGAPAAIPDSEIESLASCA